MFKSSSTSLVRRGVVNVVAGILAIAWPSVTILALARPGPTAVVLAWIVAIWAFAAGIAEMAGIFAPERTADTRALRDAA